MDAAVIDAIDLLTRQAQAHPLTHGLTLEYDGSDEGYEAAVEPTETLIRFKQSQQETPMIALFDVEGNKWQGEVMRSIKDYLSTALANPEIPILA